MMVKRVVVIVCAAVLGVLVGAVAWASIPGPDGVIHGCRKNTDGSMRVIDSEAFCPNGYTALNWAAGPAAGTPYDVVPYFGSFPVTTQQDAYPVSCPDSRRVIAAHAYGNWTDPPTPVAVEFMANANFLVTATIHALPPSDSTITWMFTCGRLTS